MTSYVILQRSADDAYVVIGIEEGREPEQAKTKLLERTRKPEERSGRFAAVPVGNWHEFSTETAVNVQTSSIKVEPTWAAPQLEVPSSPGGAQLAELAEAS